MKSMVNNIDFLLLKWYSKKGCFSCNLSRNFSFMEERNEA